MQLDVIGYRYTEDELAVLMSLQGREKIPAVPGIYRPNREQFSLGLEMLEENDILSDVNGKLLLDRIHALLISNLCDCDRFFSISKGRDFLALCVCPQLVMTVQTRDGEHWVIRVAPDVGGIREEFEHETKHFRGDCTVRMNDGDGEKEQTIPDRETLGRRIREAMTALRKQKSLFN